MSTPAPISAHPLLRRDFRLEYATLGFGWRWADPPAGYVLVFYAAREVRAIVNEQH